MMAAALRFCGCKTSAYTHTCTCTCRPSNSPVPQNDLCSSAAELMTRHGTVFGVCLVLCCLEHPGKLPHVAHAAAADITDTHYTHYTPTHHHHHHHPFPQPDDMDRFMFFSRAALEFILVTGRQPDVLHLHDWQSSAVVRGGGGDNNRETTGR